MLTWKRSRTKCKCEYSSRNVYLYLCCSSEIPRLECRRYLSHYTRRARRSGKVCTQLRFSSILHGNSVRDLRDATRDGGGLFSLTFYESTATDAAINLAVRLSVFEHSNNSITNPPPASPRRVLPSSRFYSPSLSLSPVSCPVLRNDLTRAHGLASTMYP